jgi:RimK family alpha-L-glutamate ligase
LGTKGNEAISVRILIFSARRDVGSNRRLVEAGEAMDRPVEIVDATQAVVRIAYGSRDILVNGRSVLEPRPEAALVRVGNWRPETMLGIVEVLEDSGIWTPNSSEAFRVGRDHWRSLVSLSRSGLPVPATLVAMDPERSAAEAVSHLGLPVVVKLRRSRMGVGVILCRQRDHLESVLDSLWRLGDECVVQKWIECASRSTRVLVAGDRIVAAAHFEAAAGEWRSNGARGGAARQATLSDRQVELAIAAARALDLNLCGVDLLEGPEGPVICEVNPTPGFKALEAATGINVAQEIIDFCRREA